MFTFNTIHLFAARITDDKKSPSYFLTTPVSELSFHISSMNHGFSVCRFKSAITFFAIVLFALALTSGSANAATPACGVINPDGVLLVGNALFSCNKLYKITLQTDGNLVEYKVSTGKAIWASNTFGKSPAKIVLQKSDANLVMRTVTGAAIWASGSNGGKRGTPASFTVQDDGRMVTKDTSGNQLWSADASLSITATPVAVVFRGSSTIKWSAYNVQSCKVAGPNVNATGVSGSTSTGALSSNATYMLTCQTLIGKKTNTVTVGAHGPDVTVFNAQDPMMWISKSVCTDPNDRVIPVDPYGGCPSGTNIRKIRVGDPLPYHNLHDIGQKQQHDSFPILDKKSGLYTVIAPFDMEPFNTFNLTDGTDGYDFYRLQNGWVTGANTSDGGGYGTTFFTSNCVVGGGWNFFPISNFMSGGQSTDKIAGVYWEQRGESFPGSCPASTDYVDSATEWKVFPKFSFGTTGKTPKNMHTIVSYHGFEPNDVAGFKQHGHLEVFYFTREYGATRWEVWTPIDQQPTKTTWCSEPDTVDYKGVTFVVESCRDWSAVTPATVAEIPVWPVPNVNLLKHFHFDGSFDDAWGRFGYSPAGNLMNWSTRNSTSKRDTQYSSTGVRYLAINCGAGSDGRCGQPGSQSLYQDFAPSDIPSGTYGFGINVRTENGDGHIVVAIQQIDANGVEVTHNLVEADVKGNNGTNNSADAINSVYLSSKSVYKVDNIVIDPRTAKVRFAIAPITSATFDILSAWFAPWPMPN